MGGHPKPLVTIRAASISTYIFINSVCTVQRELIMSLSFCEIL